MTQEPPGQHIHHERPSGIADSATLTRLSPSTGSPAHYDSVISSAPEGRGIGVVEQLQQRLEHVEALLGVAPVAGAEPHRPTRRRLDDSQQTAKFGAFKTEALRCLPGREFLHSNLRQCR